MLGEITLRYKWYLAFGSIQWFFFIFTNTVVVPLSIGVAFSLPQESIFSMMTYSLILTGLASVLQGWIGHQFPLMEGHSGLWWGFYLSMANTLHALGFDLREVGGSISTGVIIVGGIVMLVGIWNVTKWLHIFFTTMVRNIYVLMLSIQLGVLFFLRMFEMNNQGNIVVWSALLSLFIVMLILVLNTKGMGNLKNFALLIGLVIGWTLYRIVETKEGTSLEAGTVFFPLGSPNLIIGIVIVTVIAGLLNIINTFAAIEVAEKLYGTTVSQKRYRMSFIITGGFTMLAGVFGLVPFAPFTSSIGFLESTKVTERKPFLIGGMLLMLIGFIQTFSAFLLSMPMTIGNAVLFVAYLQLFGTGLKGLQTTPLTTSVVYRISFPIMCGIGVMMMNPTMWGSLPFFMQPLLSSGFLVAIVISLCIENSIRLKNRVHFF